MEDEALDVRVLCRTEEAGEMRRVDLLLSDELAIGMAKLLAKKEGLLCGISSGTNVAAALQMAKKLGKGKVVVTILPDTGERYYSTPLFD